MSLRVAIFEDDKDLADILKITMEEKDYIVDSYYSLKDDKWRQSDIVLGDFRNEIINFNDLKIECQKVNIPLIAISGMATAYRPQVLKPFLLEDIQVSILQELVRYKKIIPNTHNPKKASSFFKKIISALLQS